MRTILWCAALVAAAVACGGDPARGNSSAAAEPSAAAGPAAPAAPSAAVGTPTLTYFTMRG